MPEAPKFSVVTASFNALDGLKSTVDSVAAQTFQSFEHVIVDGGSSDGTRAYLESLGDCVRWISEPDGGIADALNKGVAMARGDWILVLQAEDTFVSPSSLSSAADSLRPGADITSFPVLMAESDGALRKIVSHGLGWRSFLHMTIPHQGAFCRADLFARIGTFDCSYRIAMDYDFFLRARKSGAVWNVARETISIMPATGISSRQDWAGMKERLVEFRKAQSANTGIFARAILSLYWSVYWPFKRVKVAVTNG